MSKWKSGNKTGTGGMLKSNRGKVTGGHQPGRVTPTSTGEKKTPVKPPNKG